MTTRELVSQYVEVLCKIYGKHLKTVILYGSYARGDYTKDSDIDIMVLLDLSDIDINLLDCINNSRILIKGETEQMLPKLKFDVGDIVRHKVFGVGEIIKIDNITQTYEIQFRNIRGTRRIMFRAELEKVSQPG